MADNVTVDNNALTDYVVATDDDGSSQHQYVKLEFGGDGTFTKVSADNPVPVTGTALSGTVAVSSLPAGTNTLGTVALVGSLSTAGTVAVIGALPTGSNFLGTVAGAGTVAVSSLVTSLPAGTNTLGTVALVGNLPTGSNFLGTVAGAGTVAVSSIVAQLPAGVNTLGTVVVSSHPAVTGTVAISSIAAGVNTLGTVALVGAVPTGSNFIGTVAGAGTVAVSSLVTQLPAGVNTIGTVVTNTGAGYSIYRSLDLDEGTLEIIKASAGSVYGMWVTNTATSTRFVKFYDSTTGTIGTGTPVITIGIPGNSADDVSGAFGPSGLGIAFSTGIAFGASTGVADNDTGAPAANDVIANVFYK